jgi:hypothetical protein
MNLVVKSGVAQDVDYGILAFIKNSTKHQAKIFEKILKIVYIISFITNLFKLIMNAGNLIVITVEDASELALLT